MGATVLLHGVRQLVREEMPPRRAGDVRNAVAEEDVVADGECVGADLAVEVGRLAPGVHADAREVAAEGVLHRSAGLLGQRRAAAASGLDPRLEAAVDGAALGSDRPVRVAPDATDDRRAQGSRRDRIAGVAPDATDDRRAQGGRRDRIVGAAREVAQSTPHERDLTGDALGLLLVSVVGGADDQLARHGMALHEITPGPARTVVKMVPPHAVARDANRRRGRQLRLRRGCGRRVLTFDVFGHDAAPFDRRSYRLR